jgi:hypothetical protein
MKITEGSLLEVRDQRKGVFRGIAERDFDTDTETFYPIKVAPGEFVRGLNNSWGEGDSIPCRNILCHVTVLQKVERKAV